MSKIKALLCAIICVGLAAGLSVAEETAKEPAKKEQKVKKAEPEHIDLSLTGTLAAEERVNKKNGKTNTVYVLTISEGKKVNPPKPPNKSGVNLDDYLAAEVKVDGKGYTWTNKKGVEFTKMKKVTGVEKVSK